ncbi:polysaccharide biosynthesis C-terminal domain-containing protein [Lacticaseibacillus kribbianus]|uniref:oligosaccharide flippase family protein n=1 Tax=Lacticaseibacillus kribbianus TaxID=2926292 RepID=UPI001CD3E023|nr:polysaccharide biosynthesis C-terminal domain-containing protein [Lacticaseibacillus kribbianus]
MGRVEAAIKGSVTGLSSQLITLVLKFIVRTFLIRKLGVEVIGLDSVLIDLVSMLSLADLGITTAMLYRLYRPVIDRDFKRISELLSAYRTVFRTVSLAIIVFGIILSFFLPMIIAHPTIGWGKVYTAFYLQLFATAASYLVSEQRLLLDADKKRHWSMLMDLAGYVTTAILEIVVLILFADYIGYLVIAVLQPLISGIAIHLLYKRKYGDLVTKPGRLKKDIVALYQDAREVLGNKIAGYVYSSTDNVVISIFLGVSVVGTLSNYRYITNALKGLMNSAMSAVQPLVGNLLNSDSSTHHVFKVLQRYTFIRFSIIGAFAVPVMVLSSDFIPIWTGSAKYVLPLWVPILLIADLYFGSLLGPLGEYLLGLGEFRLSRRISVIAAVTNLVISLILVTVVGYVGVLIGTVISQLITWVLNIRSLFKRFGDSRSRYLHRYLNRQIRYAAIIVICTILCRQSLNLWNLNIRSWSTLILAGFGVEVVYLGVAFLGVRRISEFRYLIDVFKRIISKR